MQDNTKCFQANDTYANTHSSSTNKTVIQNIYKICKIDKCSMCAHVRFTCYTFCAYINPESIMIPPQTRWMQRCGFDEREWTEWSHQHKNQQKKMLAKKFLSNFIYLLLFSVGCHWNGTLFLLLTSKPYRDEMRRKKFQRQQNRSIFFWRWHFSLMQTISYFPTNHTQYPSVSLSLSLMTRIVRNISIFFVHKTHSDVRCIE